MPAKKKTSAANAPTKKTKKAAPGKKSLKVVAPDEHAGPKLYTVEVVLISGMITEKFYQQNPVVSRTIEIRGDQTFEDLHFAIFDAFERDDEHLYEFQFGKKPHAREGLRIVHPMAFEGFFEDDEQPQLCADDTTLEEVLEKKGQKFFYWFDFGDDWWHQLKVAAIGAPAPRVKYPKVTARVGKSPPQYDWDDEEDDDE